MRSEGRTQTLDLRRAGIGQERPRAHWHEHDAQCAERRGLQCLTAAGREARARVVLALGITLRLHDRRRQRGAFSQRRRGYVEVEAGCELRIRGSSARRELGLEACRLIAVAQREHTEHLVGRIAGERLREHAHERVFALHHRHLTIVYPAAGGHQRGLHGLVERQILDAQRLHQRFASGSTGFVGAAAVPASAAGASGFAPSQSLESPSPLSFAR